MWLKRKTRGNKRKELCDERGQGGGGVKWLAKQGKYESFLIAFKGLNNYQILSIF